MTTWTVEALAAKGYGPDGRRMQVPQNARPVTAEKTRADACSGRAAVGESPTLSVPARQLSTSPAGDRAGQHAQAAPRGVKAVADAGHMVDGDVCAPRRLSSRAITKLQPEQRLQIEVVQHWRPRLVPGARLLGINGELPGGGKTMALRAAIRREMGYTRGCADMLAIRQGHILWLEAKVDTDQTDEQAAFADWAHSIGHGYGIFTSIADAGVLLRVHGMVA